MVNEQLRIDIRLHTEDAFAAYSFFAIQNEADNYQLALGDYSGSNSISSLSLKQGIQTSSFEQYATAHIPS